MKLGCTDDKLEVELKSADEKPFIVSADVVNSSAPAEAPKQKWVTFKSKTTNTPDPDEFNSTSSSSFPSCADLNRNNICDDQEKPPAPVDPCAGRKKCEYVDADVVGDSIAPETKINSSLTEALDALKEAQQGSGSGGKALSKSEVKAAMAKAEEKMEAKASGVKCEGEVCSDAPSGSNSTSFVKKAMAKAEEKMEAKAGGNTTNVVSKAIAAALKEAEASVEGAADQNGSGSKSKSTSRRKDVSGDDVKNEILKDLKEAAGNSVNIDVSNSSSDSNSTSSILNRVEQIKAKEDAKIKKTKAKLRAQSALLNATVAKEASIADQVDQLAARISSLEGALAGNDSKGGSPVGLIAQAVKKVKAYFRKALRD